MEQGLVQVYTGEGKGKTTAAVGLAVRALGQGRRVLLARFLKPEAPESGEVRFLSGTPGVEILTSGVGVIGGKPDPEEVRRSVSETFELVRKKAASNSFDLIILDEMNNVLHREYLPLEEMLEFLESRPAGTELVLTGRNAPEAILERADLVSRVEAVRHPYRKGIAARRGIEY